MTEKELLKLKRAEILEIMLAQSREIDSLRKELAVTKAKLEDKRICIENAGNIAEASLRLTNIFVEAQNAADLFVENVIKRKNQHLKDLSEEEDQLDPNSIQNNDKLNDHFENTHIDGGVKK